MTDEEKIKRYIEGKPYVFIDDIIESYPSNDFSFSQRHKVGKVLRSMGWIRKGTKVNKGMERKKWVLNTPTSERGLELANERLALLEKRKVSDLAIIDNMKERGYTKEEAMDYLKMIYNSKVEMVDSTKAAEIKIEQFANSICVNKYKLSRVQGIEFRICCILYYVENYYPELRYNEKYKKDRLNLINLINVYDGEPLESIEWKVFNLPNKFLEWTVKLSFKTEEAKVREYIYDKFLTTYTRRELLGDDESTRFIPIILAAAKSIKKTGSFDYPYGCDIHWIEKVNTYLKKLNERYA